MNWAFLVAQLGKNLPAKQETLVRFLDHEDPWKRDRQPTPVFLGFPGGSGSKESTCNVGDLGLIPGLGRCPGGGPNKLLQYSCLGNPYAQRSWAGYSPWGCKELGTTERLSTAQQQHAWPQVNKEKCYRQTKAKWSLTYEKETC